jgi:hypothetical protein
MAEGLLGGILGDEDEKPEAEALEALARAEAFAAAVAARLSGNDAAARGSPAPGPQAVGGFGMRDGLRG